MEEPRPTAATRRPGAGRECVEF